MPFLPMQLNTFNQLNCDWRWHIVEGAARNVNCTGWCKSQIPRLSNDGSHEFIESLRHHPRVHVRWQPDWKGGKVAMCNAAIEHISEPCVLMQVDVDELWQPWQMERIVQLFDQGPELNQMRFFCRYFVGLNIVTVGQDCYGNNPGEWLRAWRFVPERQPFFEKHEPPVLSSKRCGVMHGVCMDRDVTNEEGLIFDHWAYVFEKQLAYKQEFYGYPDALAHWSRLQMHPGPWPVKLRAFLPWVDDHAQADLLHKPAHKRNPGDGQP